MPAQFIVDAFSRGPFTGNPAAVVVLAERLPEQLMQAVAAENNLSETAFLLDDEELELRWFTPTSEIDLCGHATLAAAHVLYKELQDPRPLLEFKTASGSLRVRKEADAYAMDFPALHADPEGVPEDLRERALAAVGQTSGEALLAGGRIILILDDRRTVAELTPDLKQVRELPRGDLFVSALDGGEADIVARVFAPGVGIAEDPATGAAHCAFAPYWCERLGRTELTSRQLSPRGGYLQCRWRPGDDRVDLIGSCQTFSRGEIEL